MAVDLAGVARRSDEAVRDARAELVHAVREAARQGLTQAQIAALIGRSQPEVSRLLRFHGRGPRARRLRQHAREVRDRHGPARWATSSPRGDVTAFAAM